MAMPPPLARGLGRRRLDKGRYFVRPTENPPNTDYGTEPQFLWRIDPGVDWEEGKTEKKTILYIYIYFFNFFLENFSCII